MKTLATLVSDDKLVVAAESKRDKPIVDSLISSISVLVNQLTDAEMKNICFWLNLSLNLTR